MCVFRELLTHQKDFVLAERRRRARQKQQPTKVTTPNVHIPITQVDITQFSSANSRPGSGKTRKARRAMSVVNRPKGLFERPVGCRPDGSSKASPVPSVPHTPRQLAIPALTVDAASSRGSSPEPQPFTPSGSGEVAGQGQGEGGTESRVDGLLQEVSNRLSLRDES